MNVKNLLIIMELYEVSAKTGENLDHTIDCVIKSIISNNAYITKQKYTQLNNKSKKKFYWIQ